MPVFKELRLFVFAYARGNNVTNENSYRKYFLPRHKVKLTTSKLIEEIFMINELKDNSIKYFYWKN